VTVDGTILIERLDELKIGVAQIEVGEAGARRRDLLCANDAEAEAVAEEGKS